MILFPSVRAVIWIAAYVSCVVSPSPESVPRLTPLNAVKVTEYYISMLLERIVEFDARPGSSGISLVDKQELITPSGNLELLEPVYEDADSTAFVASDLENAPPKLSVRFWSSSNQDIQKSSVGLIRKDSSATQSVSDGGEPVISEGRSSWRDYLFGGICRFFLPKKVHPYRALLEEVDWAVKHMVINQFVYGLSTNRARLFIQLPRMVAEIYHMSRPGELSDAAGLLPMWGDPGGSRVRVQVSQKYTVLSRILDQPGRDVKSLHTFKLIINIGISLFDNLAYLHSVGLVYGNVSSDSLAFLKPHGQKRILIFTNFKDATMIHKTEVSDLDIPKKIMNPDGTVSLQSRVPRTPWDGVTRYSFRDDMFSAIEWIANYISAPDGPKRISPYMQSVLEAGPDAEAVRSVRLRRDMFEGCCEFGAQSEKIHALLSRISQYIRSTPTPGSMPRVRGVIARLREVIELAHEGEIDIVYPPHEPRVRFEDSNL
jgi:hypothetical protein